MSKRSRIPSVLPALGVLLSFAGAGHGARAELVAGWDFSQYFADALLSIDGETYTDTLGANYSSLLLSDQNVYGAGPAASVFGTMYLNGEFGSTSQPIGSGEESILPSQVVGSLQSNINAPAAFGVIEFESFTVLQLFGQIFANEIAMTALGSGDAVFRADKGSSAATGNWILSFGARTQPSLGTGASSIEVGFSPTGSGYAPVGTANLTLVDTAYQFNLGPADSQTAFVRLRFNPTPPELPMVDNLMITVPEPAAGGATLATLATLAALATRRHHRCS
jgi:hypothetical protein